MTNEQFNREYHLLDRLTQGAIVTHHAQSANGAMVMVHFLRGSAEENAGIGRWLDALTSERRARILAVVDVDGTTAVVSKFILDFTSFQDWLATGATQPPSTREESAGLPMTPAATSVPATSPTPRAASGDGPPAPAPSAPAHSSGPGEFTRLFRPAVPQVEPQPTVSPPSPAASPRLTPAQSPGAPGEFTLLFRGTPPTSSAPAMAAQRDPAPPPVASAAAPDQPIAPIQAIDTPPASSSPAQRPGEFTRMFGAPVPLAGPPAPIDTAEPLVQKAHASREDIQPASIVEAPVPAAQAPFAIPKSVSPPPTEPTFDSAWSGFSAPAPQPPPPAASGPGEYTRLFGSPAAPPPVAPLPSPMPAPSPPPSIDWGSSSASASSNRGDSYLERLVGGADPAPNFPPAPQNIPPVPQVFSGPSEFTRIISAPPPSPALTPPAARPVVPPPPVVPVGNPQSRGDRVLLFSLVGVVLLAVVLVVVFLIAT